MSAFLPAQLRALAPFVEFSGIEEDGDSTLLEDLIRIEALYWEGRHKEFLSELSKLLDRFKKERQVALAVVSAGGGIWITSLLMRTLSACYDANVSSEKFCEKFSESFGVNVKFEPSNAD